MTTRQTPDAVREAAEEIVALPHGLDIGYAQDIARRILAALDSRAGDAGATVITISVRPDGSTSFHSSIPPGQNWLDTLAAMNHGFLEFQRQFEESNKCPIKPSTAATPAPAVDAVPAGEVERLREALTPSGDTKAAYHGEFRFDVMFPSLDEDDDEPVPHPVVVPWDTVKEIMAAISSRASLSHGEGRK